MLKIIDALIKNIKPEKKQTVIPEVVKAPVPVTETVRQEAPTASPEFHEICNKVRSWYQYDTIKVSDGTEIKLDRKRSKLFYAQMNLLNNMPVSTGSCKIEPEEKEDIRRKRPTAEELIDELTIPLPTEEQRRLYREIEENNDFILDAGMAMELGWI